MTVLAICSSLILFSVITTMPIQVEAAHQRRSRPSLFGVRLMVFSSDQRRLAIVKGRVRDNDVFNGEVEVWNLETGQVERTFSEFTGPVVSVALSPTGGMIVTASWEPHPTSPTLEGSHDEDSTGLIKLWDVETGELKWVRRAHSESIGPLTLSPDGRIIASAGRRPSMNFMGSEVKLWQAGSGDLIHEIVYRAPVTAVRFSPQGDILAVRKFIYSEIKAEIKLYDAKSLKELRTLKEAHRKVRRWSTSATAGWGLMVFSPDGKAVAAGVPSYEPRPGSRNIRGSESLPAYSDVQIWDVQTGKAVRTLTGHSRTVVSAAFSSDGSVLASATTGVTAHGWDVGSGEGKWTARTPRSASYVVFSPDGDTLAVADYDDSIRLWNLSNGELVKVLVGAAASGNVSVERLVVSAERVLAVAFAGDGKTLVAGSDMGSIKLWDVLAGVQKSRLAGHKGSVSSIEFLGTAVLSGSNDGTVRLWDLNRGSVERAFQCHGPVNCVAASPDGTLVACATEDRKVELWDTKSASLKLTFSGHAGAVLAVAFSPDSKSIASASADRTVKVWDAGTSEVISVLSDHSAPVRAVVFDPAGSAVVTSDGTIVKVWDLKTGAPKLTLKGHDAPVTSLAFSPNGSVLASGSEDKTVRLWDLGTGTVKKTLKGHDIGVFCIAFSPDGKVLAIGSGNDSVVLWDAETGELKRALKQAARLPVRKR